MTQSALGLGQATRVTRTALISLLPPRCGSTFVPDEPETQTAERKPLPLCSNFNRKLIEWLAYVIDEIIDQ